VRVQCTWHAVAHFDRERHLSSLARLGFLALARLGLSLPERAEQVLCVADRR
tara:strand:+ start:232 stop:387 length:156 start_codon:yes stop_codon:yes gene_type:complete